MASCQVPKNAAVSLVCRAAPQEKILRPCEIQQLFQSVSAATHLNTQNNAKSLQLLPLFGFILVICDLLDDPHRAPFWLLEAISCIPRKPESGVGHFQSDITGFPFALTCNM